MHTAPSGGKSDANLLRRSFERPGINNELPPNVGTGHEAAKQDSRKAEAKGVR
jgi:hypothetical protein